MRRISGFIWLDWVLDKLWSRHGVEREEVEEAFFNPPYKVRRTCQDRYLLYGQSQDGRFLFVVFVWEDEQIRVTTARDMTPTERRYYGRK